MMAYSQELGGTSEYIADDVNRIADTETAKSNHIDSTKPLELKYVKNNKSVKLSEEGGNAEWDNRGLPDLITENYAGETVENLKNSSEELLEDEGVSTDVRTCRSDSRNMSIDLSNTPHLSGEMVTENVTTNCRFNSGDVELVETDIVTEFETHNRYPELAYSSRELFEDFASNLANKEFEDIGEGSNCGSRTAAENEAEDDAEDKGDERVREAWDSAVDSWGGANSVVVEEEEILQKVSDPDSTASRERWCNCDCDEDESRGSSCCDPYYEDDSADYNPQRTDTLLEMRDDDEKIFYDGRAKDLSFLVDEYSHYFD